MKNNSERYKMCYVDHTTHHMLKVKSASESKTIGQVIKELVEKEK